MHEQSMCLKAVLQGFYGRKPFFQYLIISHWIIFAQVKDSLQFGCLTGIQRHPYFIMWYNFSQGN